MGAQRSIHSVPVNRIRKIDIEVCNDRMALIGQVGWRRKIILFDVLQLTDQSLLRRASGTRVPFDGPLIDHDCKGEAGMLLGGRHD